METVESKIQLACELIRIPDGLPLDRARDAPTRAQAMLSNTQIVHANSPLLAVADETDATFNR